MGAKEGKGNFIVFGSIGLVNPRLEQQYGKAWWMELMLGSVYTDSRCEGSHYWGILWRMEFQFQMWPTTWVNTFSNTKRKLKSTILNPNCFLFCFVFFSFTQANPHLTFSCLSILHAEITGVSCHARLALLSGSQMRNLEKMTMWKCLQMLKYFFCESFYGRQYYQLSLLWGLHG